METNQIIILCLFGVVLILLVVLLISRMNHKKELERRLKEVRDDATLEVATRTNSLLRITMIPFLWSMRTEIMRDNYIKVDEYFNQFIKEPGILYIGLVDLNGKIKLATDKKTEDKLFVDIYKENISGIESINIIERINDEKLIVAPITGINEKLGTIVILYHPREV